MKNVQWILWIIIHGPKMSGADPRHTLGGAIALAALQPEIGRLGLDRFPCVVAEGRRHGEVARLVDLKPTYYSAAFGPASSVERRPTGGVTVLPDGHEFAFRPEDTWDMWEAAKAYLRRVFPGGGNVTVAAGRELLMGAMHAPASQFKTGIHQLVVNNDGQVAHSVVALAGGDF